MSEKPQDRSTSHAKTVDLDHQKNALDRALSLKEHFEQAKTAQQSLEAHKTRDAERQGHTVHAPKPQQHLRPQGPARREVDRTLDKEQLSKEAQRARELYQERLNEQKMLNVDHDRDKDNADRDR